MANYMNKWIKCACERLRQDYGYRCAICGSGANLQFAHTGETPLSYSMGRGRKERIYDILKHRLDYTLLCRDCHIEFDKNKK